MVRFAAFTAFPLMLGLGLVAKEFIVLTIGEKWLVSAGYIQILCVAGAVMPISTLLSSLIITRGRSDIFLWCTLSLGVIQIVTLMLIHWLGYSISTMIVAYVCLIFVWLFIWHFFVCRLTGYSLLMLLKDTMPFALAAIAVMAVTWMGTRTIGNLWLLLISRCAMAAAHYYITMRIAGAVILKECVAFIRRKRL